MLHSVSVSVSMYGGLSLKRMSLFIEIQCCVPQQINLHTTNPSPLILPIYVELLLLKRCRQRRKRSCWRRTKTWSVWRENRSFQSSSPSSSSTWPTSSVFSSFFLFPFQIVSNFRMELCNTTHILERHRSIILTSKVFKSYCHHHFSSYSLLSVILYLLSFSLSKGVGLCQNHESLLVT